jgi:cytochrome oxidase assembly protein ShyY1
MLTIVLVINVLLAVLCLGVAWQVWRLKQALGQVADTLIEVEQTTHPVLYGAPQSITDSYQRVEEVCDRIRQAEPQLRRARQAIRLIVWQRRRFR